MEAKRIGKRYGGPWYSRIAERMKFESGTGAQFSGITVKNKRKGKIIWREYKLFIEVPTYETCHVKIKLFPNKHKSPNVTVDGPSESPHRYGNGGLCMWYPWDSSEMRWNFYDGLLHLLVLIQAHLFREAWWRENNEWLGPEAPHGQSIPSSEHNISSENLT